MTQIDVRSILNNLIEESPYKKILQRVVDSRSANFLISRLENIAALERVNEILLGGEGLAGKEFNDYMYETLDIKVREQAVDNLPLQHGKLNGRDYVAVSNHALGAADGVLLMKALSQYAQPTMMVGKILSYIKEFDDYFIVVRGLSLHDRKKMIKDFKELAHSQRLIVGFPSGLVSKKNLFTGKIKDSKWKNGILHAVKEKRDVIPIYFGGELPESYFNKVRFLNMLTAVPGLQKICTELRAIYQPRATFELAGKEFDVVYGKPISYEYFTSVNTSEQRSSLMQVLKEHVYRLKEDPYVDFADTLQYSQ